MADQDLRNQFDAAVATARENPGELDAWDQIEELNEELNCPDEVAALYQEVLGGDVDDELVLELGERAAGFMEEWLGDEPAAVEGVLKRMLSVDPQSETAFQRLTVVYTVTERWDDLLGLYDRALADAEDQARRVRLLDEAAQVAKDVANQPDKAIGYLQRLLPLRPGDSQLEHSLERLLERHERWADLIALWESRLAGESGEERERSRARIAECWLDNLNDPAKALEATRPLLAEAADDKQACTLLERIVTTPNASTGVRDGALELLRRHYEETERPREIVRVLEAAIELADPQSSQALREEAGARLAELEDDAAAMDHYAALLALNPASAVTQEKMRQIAQRSHDFTRYANGVAAAAEICTDVPRKVALLAEAARTRLEMLEDEAGAIHFYQAALAQEGLGPERERRIARRLSELLDRADRKQERLDVLVRLAGTESSPVGRRAVIGEAARLAETLGETDRALELWRSRIDDDNGDMFAIDAMISLLIDSQRWEPLIELLGLRAQKTASDTQRRDDLVRIARTYDARLDRPQEAIGAWLQVQEQCGESADTVDGLADLYARTEKWAELAALLERASVVETRRVTDRLVRLSDAYRAHLDAPDRALAGYRGALAIDSRHEEARAGMTALLEVESCRAGAATALAIAYRENEDWPRFLELLEPRLMDATSDEARLGILREAAEIQQHGTGDPAAALHSLARAMPLAPKDRVLEGQVVELAGLTGQWDAAATAYDQTAAALVSDPHAASRLRYEHATILESRLHDAEGALSSYLAVAAVQPDNLPATRGVVRLGTRLSRWDEVAATLLASVVARGEIDGGLIDEIEAVATESEAFAAAAAALTRALGAADGLTPRLAFELHRIVAVWHRDRLADLDAAKSAFLTALAFDGDRPETLRALAALQRSTPDRALYETLRRIADADPKDLDVVFEAAELAIEHLDSPADVSASLSALLGRATAAWRGTAEAHGSRSPDICVNWAIERLVDHHIAQGAAAAAVDLLIDATRLPFGAQTRRAMRHRAAGIAAEQLGDNSIAIEMYRGVLSQSPDDTEAIERLADVYEKEGRVAEQLSLRRHQLTLPRDVEARLALRLEIADLVARIEAQGGRADVLRANLDEQPGHPQSVDTLYELLDAKSQHAELADLLEQQATVLEERDEGARAADLWARAAAVTEAHTKELDRAIHGWRRVVDLSPSKEAFAALARLYVEREQHAQAVPWFENLLTKSDDEERPEVVLDLAKAHLGAEQVDHAIACLEKNIDEDRPVLALRELLADLYRQTEAWEPLARHLTRSLPQLADDDKALAYAKEAAQTYTDVLESSASAIPALERALELVPGDRALRTQLAVGLRVAGRLDEARELLATLIKEFGRRRSAERAAVHVELALVAQAEGNNKEALKQMEQASKMDVGNAQIQKRLAELAREAGKQDKAERTYRALLLLVRRQPPGGDVSAVGVSEVLFELHKLAGEREQHDQAKELLESALETAVQSDVEVRRLRRSLLAHNETQTLLRVLRMRLDATEKQADRASLLADIAEVLDKHLDKPSEALDAILEAIEASPERSELHESARALARRTESTRRYIDTVEKVVDHLRRKEDPPKVAKLLMQAGEAVEEDAGDLRGALDIYRRVEALGERTAEAYFAIARVSGALGDTEEQVRVLDAMLALAHSDEPSAAQTNALYRLSEIFIATEERREQGLGLLEQAFAAEPRYAQAGASLRVAAAANPEDDRVMALYERVARKANDGAMLLDFLERRAQRADATPEQVREAVTVAVENQRFERGEALLERAVEAARASEEGVGGAVWAVVSLCERRTEAGDFASARGLVYEIAEVADPDRVRALALDVAKRARAPEPALAAEVYEFLRQRDPSAREIWEPLVELLRQLGDGEQLQVVIGATLPSLVDPAERNAMRMQQAIFLIENLDRPADAAEILRDVLLDDPDHLKAAALLEDVYRRAGDHDALADFLQQRFVDATERRNPDTVIDVAQRLGGLLDQMAAAAAEAGEPPPADALSVYRTALDIAPNSPEMLRAVLAHLDPEDDPRHKAGLMERLIQLEEPDQSVALANELGALWDILGDESGLQRALELGHRANPSDPALHQRLETWYRERDMYPALAALMADDATRLSANPDTVGAAVTRLREAAGVYRDLLSNPGAAADVLRRARELAPNDAGLVSELAMCLSASGDLAGAADVIGGALAGDIAGAERVDLLLTRSDLQLHLGNEGLALADLEEAHGMDAERVGSRLIDTLDTVRERAEGRGDRELERETTMRLAPLLRGVDEERLRGLLSGWIEREPRDQEALYLLRDMERAAERWDGVLLACSRLVAVEEGDAQIQAALELAEAAEKAERPRDALDGLEQVHQAQPDSDEIRNRLRKFYELSGAHRELAAILLADGDHATDEEVRYDAYRRAAQVLVYELGDAAAAIEPAKKARELRPDDHDATVLFVDVLTAGGHTSEAVAVLEPAIAAHRRRSPELGALQQRMARVAASVGDTETQLAWLKKAFDVDRKNGEIAAELAQLATEAGDYDLALKPLRAITLMENPGPISRVMALLWEAKIEHARGNRAKAELWAKKALREDPDFAEAQEFLDQLG